MSNILESIGSDRAVTILCFSGFDIENVALGLSLFNILKGEKRRVEIVSYRKGDIPIYLNYLPNFSSIKGKIDFKDSLLLELGRCDKEFTPKEIFNIFKERFKVNSSAYICFYTSLLLDREYFNVSSDIIPSDIEIEKISHSLNRRRSLSSLRVLEKVEKRKEEGEKRKKK